MDTAFDPTLLWRWLAARSVARGLPLPVPDQGGMRVDTGLPNETQRYVFAGPVPAIARITASIAAPRIFVKMCGGGEQLLKLAPPGWELQPRAWFMTQPVHHDADAPLAPGYRIELAQEGPAIAARVLAKDGSVAASGYAVEHEGLYVYDRIGTEPAHRRRGLGRALMSALGSMQRSRNAQRVLVATEEGRTLYASLGWTVLSDYSTIVIPD